MSLSYMKPTINNIKIAKINRIKQDNCLYIIDGSVVYPQIRMTVF